MRPSMPDRNTLKLLETWRLRCLRGANVHYKTSRRLEKREHAITIINVAASIAVVLLSSSYWLDAEHNRNVAILIGITSLCVLITTVLQYIFDYKTKAYIHWHTASIFADTNKKI